jgi:uncharacterized damage-inducible protein DinB
MDAALAACLTSYSINDHLVQKALEGLTEESAWKHPGDGNPIYWIVGHVAIYRHSLASALGVGQELPWAAAFKRLSQPDPNAKGPSLAEIQAAMVAALGPLTARFAELTDEELAAPAPFKLPTPDPTLRGAIAFFGYHETYHMGQVAYVKKWLGFPGIVDGQ